MQCEDYQRWLSSYVDGLLQADQRRELEAHLTTCPTCPATLASMQKLLVSLRQLGDVEAPTDLLRGVQKKLVAEPAWENWFASIRYVLSGHRLAVALTAALVVVIATPLFRQQPAYKAYELTKTDKKDAVLSSRLKERKNVASEERARDRDERILRPSTAVGGAATNSGIAGDEYEYAEPSSLAIQGDLESGDKRADQKGTMSLSRQLSDGQRGVILENRRADSSQPKSKEEIDDLRIVDETGEGTDRDPAISSESKRSDVSAGMTWEEHVALRGPMAQTSVAPSVQVEWTISDRAKAVEGLRTWLVSAKGTLQQPNEERLVLQIPRTAYAALLNELSRQGHVHVLTRDDLEKNKSNESPAKYPAPSSAPSDLPPDRLVVELYLLNSQ